MLIPPRSIEIDTRHQYNFLRRYKIMMNRFSLSRPFKLTDAHKQTKEGYHLLPDFHVMQTRARFVICLVIYRPASAYNPSKSAIYIIHSPRGVTHNGGKIRNTYTFDNIVVFFSRIVETRSRIEEEFEKRRDASIERI